MPISDVDDIAMAVTLGLFTIGILASVVVTLIFGHATDPSKGVVITGLLMALAGATSFFFKGSRGR